VWKYLVKDDLYYLIPDKRLYPAACDLEFCRVLVDEGEDLPFTTFEEREQVQYHGKILEELKS